MVDLHGSSANTENLLRIRSEPANRLKETVHSDDYQLSYPLELQMATLEDWYQMKKNWTIALSLKYGDMKIGIITVLNVVAVR